MWVGSHRHTSDVKTRCSKQYVISDLSRIDGNALSRSGKLLGKAEKGVSCETNIRTDEKNKLHEIRIKQFTLHNIPHKIVYKQLRWPQIVKRIKQKQPGRGIELIVQKCQFFCADTLLTWDLRLTVTVKGTNRIIGPNESIWVVRARVTVHVNCTYFSLLLLPHTQFSACFYQRSIWNFLNTFHQRRVCERKSHNH
jgi:hypothetical protein